jgi:ADP-heptose:LPS heptosyltransferase
MSNRAPRKIVVFCLPGIGDAILFTPALAMLRRAFPRARITVITMFRGTADILANNPDLDEVRRFDFFNAGLLAGLRYVWSLRREGHELSIMPFPANRIEYNVVNRLVGRRWRAAHRYRHQSWRNLWFLNNIVAGEDPRLHNVEENLRLMELICRRLGVDVESVRPRDGTERQLRLTLTDADEQHAAARLAELGVGRQPLLFGLHTFSSTFKNMHRKCWDKDQFVRLVQRLAPQFPSARFLLFTGPSDEEVNRYILARANAPVALVQEPDLRRALAILKRCTVFVGNDSGLMHLAAALGVPVVALFGPTDWRRLHPWNVPHRIVRNDLPCMPCFYYSSRPLCCPAGIDYACLRELTVDAVHNAVVDILAQTHAFPLPAKR